MTQIGFVGLGKMGGNMVHRIRRDSAHEVVAFDFDDIEITAGDGVAFATAIGSCMTTDSKGAREPLRFRLTMGLRKIDGRWRIMHEHHSLPAV